MATAALLSTGCPGDDGDPTQEGSTGPGGTTTTGQPQDSSSSSSPPATTTTTGPVDSSSSSDEGSSSGEGSTGDQPGSNYGDCRDDVMACAAGEVCMQVGPLGAVCAEQGCRSADECDLPTSGDAVVACDDANGNFSIDCYLDCSGGETCPDDMVCVGAGVCVWPAIAPGGGMCPDWDLGTMVPQTAMGDTTDRFNDVIQGCAGGGGGDDFIYLFTAPADGTYRFDTAGTMYDTALSLLDECGGVELACNDDAAPPMVLTSAIEFDMVMDQSVIIVVDSYGGTVGPFTLNVSEVVMR